MERVRSCANCFYHEIVDGEYMCDSLTMHTRSEPYIKNPRNQNDCWCFSWDWGVNFTHLTGETHKDNITCPVCGHVDEDSRQVFGDLKGDIKDYDCDNCGAILSVSKRAEIIYHTKVVKFREENKNGN